MFFSFGLGKEFMLVKKNVNSILALLSILLTFGLAEIFLQVTDFSYPSLYRLSEVVGVEHLPGTNGWNRKEGEQYIKINRDGMRGPVFAKTKPPNTLRIAVLGDSMTEGSQVAVKNIFSSILENDLNKCNLFGEKKVEVINFGVSDYGTAQELIVLREKVWLYDPDFVLLAIFTQNDISNNSAALEKQKMRPFFTYQGDELLLDNSFRYLKEFKIKTSWAWRGLLFISQYSRTIQLLNKTRHRLMENEKRFIRLNVQMDQLGISVYFHPKNKEWNEAWKITESLIIKMRDETKQRGAKFMIATLSNDIQVHPDLQVQQDFIKENGLNDLFYPESRIEEFATKNKISNVILAPKLAEHAQRNGVFLHGFENYGMGFGHWNENGHRLAGHLIAEKFCAEVH